MILKEQLPKAAKILADYGVDIIRNSDRIKIINNWAVGKNRLLEVYKQDVSKFFDIEEGIICEFAYPSDPPMNFKIRKWKADQGCSRLIFEIETFEKKLIAEYWLLLRAGNPQNQWCFDHRLTKNGYRGAGFGNAISEIVDVSMQEFANGRYEEQVVTCEVRQVDALLWFLKNGYVPSDDRSCFLVDQILSPDGPENFEVSSNPIGDMDLYIFRKGQVDWEDVENFGELKQRGGVVTVNLEKRFKPKDVPFRYMVGRMIRKVLTM